MNLRRLCLLASAVLFAGCSDASHRKASPPGDTDGDGTAVRNVTNFTTTEQLQQIRQDRTCLVIIVHDQTKVYGDTLPPLTFTMEGACLESGEVDAAAVKAAITLTTAATQSSSVGDYPISVQIDEQALPPSIHDIAVSPGTLRILKAHLFVQANDINNLNVVQVPLQVTWQVRGLKLADTESIVQGLEFEDYNAIHASPALEVWHYCLKPRTVAPPEYLGMLYDPNDRGQNLCLPEDTEVDPANLAAFDHVKFQYPSESCETHSGSEAEGYLLSSYCYALRPVGPLTAGGNYLVHYLPGYLNVHVVMYVYQTDAVSVAMDAALPPSHGLRFYLPREAQPFLRFAAKRYREDRAMAALSDTDLDAWLSQAADNLNNTLSYLVGYLSADNWSNGSYRNGNGDWVPADAGLQAARAKMADYVLAAARYVRKRHLQNEKALFIQWRDVDRYQQYTTRFMTLFGPSDTPPDDLAARAAAQTAIGLTGPAVSMGIFVATGAAMAATLSATGVAATASLFVGFSGAVTTLSGVTVAASVAAATAATVGGAIAGAVLAVVVAGVKIWQIVELDQVEGQYDQRIAAADSAALTDISNEELTLAVVFMRASTGPTITQPAFNGSWLNTYMDGWVCY